MHTRTSALSSRGTVSHVFFFKKRKGEKRGRCEYYKIDTRCTELKSLNLPRTATRKDRRHAKTEPIECLAATQSIQKSVRRWRTGQFCNFPQILTSADSKTDRYRYAAPLLNRYASETQKKPSWSKVGKCGSGGSSIRRQLQSCMAMSKSDLWMHYTGPPGLLAREPGTPIVSATFYYFS